MDCFYAAVEMRDFPEYRDIPLAVGGDGPRSVLCTCNYLARAFGVRSAMSAVKRITSSAGFGKIFRERLLKRSFPPVGNP